MNDISERYRVTITVTDRPDRYTSRAELASAQIDTRTLNGVLTGLPGVAQAIVHEIGHQLDLAAETERANEEKKKFEVGGTVLPLNVDDMPPCDICGAPPGAAHDMDAHETAEGDR